MLPSVIGNGFALFFAWLFALAAIQKLRAPDYYRNLMSTYIPALPPGRIMLLPLAFGELTLAVLLLIPQLRVYGLVGSAGLLLAYAAMMAWQIRDGRAGMDCGCSGPASVLAVSPALVVRNLLCAGLALLAMSAPIGAVVGAVGLILSAVISLFMITFYLCSDQVIANAQQMAGDV